MITRYFPTNNKTEHSGTKQISACKKQQKTLKLNGMYWQWLPFIIKNDSESENII